MKRNKTVAGPTGFEVLDLEYALLELFGTTSRWQHSAQTFRSPARLRNAFKAAARQIEQRMDDITTADVRLLHAVRCDLDALKSAADRLTTSEQAALVSVAAALLHLVARLLGFDWHLGKPNRQLMYAQTPDQIAYDDRRAHPRESVVEIQERMFSTRCELVDLLSSQGFRPSQISQVIRLTENQVRRLLDRDRVSKDNDQKHQNDDGLTPS